MKRPFLLAALLLAAGVAAAQAQPPAAPSPAAGATVSAPLPWPARLPVESGLKPETVALKGPGWSPMGTIEPVKPPIMAIHLSSRESAAAARSQKEDWDLLCTRLAGAADCAPQFEKSGGFLFVPSYDDEPVTPSPSRASLMFRFISARRAAGQANAKPPAVIVERTWFALYDPLPPKSKPGDPPVAEVVPDPRALVVLLPGMFGTPTDQIVGLTRRLRQEGYSVLRMMSQPSRFTESVTYALPLDGDLAAAIPPIAADLTDRAAEAAYAVESAVLYVQQERPALRGLPRFAIGMSGGAMLLPVVVAREPEAYTGAVSIAGGVDYLRILTTSNYVDWINAVRVKWIAPPAANAGGIPAVKPAPSSQRLEELAKLYRAAAPLDSVNLMVLVKGVPWLMLHGTTDKAVPASTGEEMWELLGKPERITIKGGHEWLFMTLSGRFNTITEWIDKRLQPAAATPARAQPAGAR
ncbi:MAG TPA: alpha/beta hydrolase [Phycisphaerales bacterium]|nr:alpha/beta hydrolase [Phycisphaerales bacterium]